MHARAAAPLDLDLLALALAPVPVDETDQYGGEQFNTQSVCKWRIARPGLNKAACLPSQHQPIVQCRIKSWHVARFFLCMPASCPMNSFGQVHMYMLARLCSLLTLLRIHRLLVLLTGERFGVRPLLPLWCLCSEFSPLQSPSSAKGELHDCRSVL